MFTGGLQRVARLTVDEYENQRKKNEEKQAIRDQKKVRAGPSISIIDVFSICQSVNFLNMCNAD